jgi:hypothetical protein
VKMSRQGGFVLRPGVGVASSQLRRWIVSRVRVVAGHGPTASRVAPERVGKGRSLGMTLCSLEFSARVTAGKSCFQGRAVCSPGLRRE